MRPPPQTGQHHQNGMVAEVCSTCAHAGRKGLPDLLGSQALGERVMHPLARGGYRGFQAG